MHRWFYVDSIPRLHSFFLEIELISVGISFILNIRNRKMVFFVAKKFNSAALSVYLCTFSTTFNSFLQVAIALVTLIPMHTVHSLLSKKFQNCCSNSRMKTVNVCFHWKQAEGAPPHHTPAENRKM